MKHHVLVTIIGLSLGISAASAEPPQCYNLASLQGSYAVIGNYGANAAIALAVQYLDGNGNLTRNGTVNQPTAGSTTGERTITTTTNTGTYTVNCDGTGTVTRTVVQSNGNMSTVKDDFVITAAMRRGGQLIATTIVAAQQTPSVVVPGGVFVVFTHTRLPDRVGPPQL
jgi:hypothetical protein